MVRRNLLAVISVLVVTQLACSSLLGSGAGGGGGGSGYFTDPGKPLDVSLTLDTANAVTQVIPLDGGVITATGADGTRYTLSIPEGALPGDVEISMTPVSAVADLPFSGGLGGAVLLEPSGLTFDDFVTLQIEPANPIPLENQILFGFEEQGEDLHLAIPVDDPGTIQIRLLHFSGAGVASGLSAERAAVMVRQADRAEARLTSEVGEFIQKLRQGEATDPSGIGDRLDAFFDTVVEPRMKAAASASGNCAQGEKALREFLAWERQRQLLNAADDGTFQKVLKEFVPIVLRKCLDEEFDRCANKHLIGGMLPILVRVERWMGVWGTAEVASWQELRAYGEGLMRRCFQWDLEFESAVTVEHERSGGYDSRVKAKVPLKAQGSALAPSISGTAALNNVDFTFRLEDCTVESIRGGGTFTADSLTWELSVRKDRDGNPQYFVRDFRLKYEPGQTSESMTITCKGRDQKMTTPPSPMWTMAFVVTHLPELGSGDAPAPPPSIDGLMGGIPTASMEQGFEAKFWRVSEAEQMATKEWQGESQMDGRVFEGGEFRLIHRPQ
jgi:hypothetical protein